MPTCCPCMIAFTTGQAMTQSKNAVITNTGTRCQNGTLARISDMSPWLHALPQSASDKRPAGTSWLR